METVFAWVVRLQEQPSFINIEYLAFLKVWKYFQEQFLFGCQTDTDFQRAILFGYNRYRLYKKACFCRKVILVFQFDRLA